MDLKRVCRAIGTRSIDSFVCVHIHTRASNRLYGQIRIDAAAHELGTANVQRNLTKKLPGTQDRSSQLSLSTSGASPMCS